MFAESQRKGLLYFGDEEKAKEEFLKWLTGTIMSLISQSLSLNMATGIFTATIKANVPRLRKFQDASQRTSATCDLSNAR
jgi:hypothetical protein